MKQKSRMHIGFNVHIEYGEIVDGREVKQGQREVHNLAVDTGLVYCRDHGFNLCDTIGYGTGDTTPEGTDTELEDSVFSEVMTVAPSYDAATGWAETIYYHYLGSEAGSLGMITESGLFVGTVMIARVTFAGVNKTATTYIKTVWEMVLSAAEA